MKPDEKSFTTLLGESFDPAEISGERLAGDRAGNGKFGITQFGDAGETFGLGQPFFLHPQMQEAERAV